MCRYGIKIYKDHYVCFTCRKAFKSVTKCPKCHQDMTLMGKDLKVPPAKNVKQWKKIELLAQELGWKFVSCGCGGPRYTTEFRESAAPSLKGLNTVKGLIRSKKELKDVEWKKILYKHRSVE